MNELRDLADIRFRFFASAAFIRFRSNSLVAAQQVSQYRSFTDIESSKSKTAPSRKLIGVVRCGTIRAVMRRKAQTSFPKAAKKPLAAVWSRHEPRHARI